MIAIPAVDLREGACVQLVGGAYDAERVRLPDPAKVAEGWQARGFGELHIVDLDAATGRGDNEAVIAAVVAAVRRDGSRPVSLQVGGGMRSAERIEATLSLGVDRVVVGTKAIEDTDWLAEQAARWPGRIVVAADVHGREVVTRGWAAGSGRQIGDVLRTIDALPLAGVLVTAVHLEGRLEGPDLELTRAVAAGTQLAVQASGGIRNLTDIASLAAAGATRAVIGMALYTGVLDPDALAREYGR
ncbi:MAG: 1-(5-phosphoribosyl)-5-[(5-phosphoribosylamino)methylideneamino]imidazole-4-carboxamide isomerase [Gemmatimonadales bacterium]